MSQTAKMRKYKGGPCERCRLRTPTQEVRWFGPVCDGWPHGELIQKYLCIPCVDVSSVVYPPRSVTPMPGWSKWVDAEAKKQAQKAAADLIRNQMTLGEW